jgi:hypothetical protein
MVHVSLANKEKDVAQEENPARCTTGTDREGDYQKGWNSEPK